MVTSKESLFTSMERNYLQIAMTSYLAVLRRSIAKEVNQDVRRFRQNDIDAVIALSDKLGGM